jgi:hypothetical protein
MLESDPASWQPHTWQHKQLRWAILQGLYGHSDEFRRAGATLAATHALVMRLHYHDLDEVDRALRLRKLLPKRRRPPKQWRDSEAHSYLWSLARLSRWFGLAGQRKPQVWEDNCPDRWDETLHYFLQEKHEESLAGRVSGSLYTLEVSQPYRLPWTEHPPRRRGRPALQTPGPSSEEFKALKVLAACVARRLLGQSWEEIADTCGLTTHTGDDTLGTLEVATRCRRLAEHLRIYRPL